MTTTKHAATTPGPWHTNRGGVESADGSPVCAGQFNATNGTTLEQCNANMTAIAAVPELLQSLREIRDVAALVAHGEAVDLGGATFADWACRLADAAVSKANP